MENEQLKKMLQEQKEKAIIDRKRLYAVFLKRKRNELKLTLTEVAKGICTPSYLSRIENNIVTVGEEYFELLFKKLNIDFNQLKDAKDYEILEDLLKCFLLRDSSKASLIIEEALSTTLYVEIEYEIMILYDSILKRLYQEANDEIIKLSNKMELLLDKELITFLFLRSYYAFKIGNGVFAFDQILVLCESNVLTGTFMYAVYDLALDIFMYIGIHELFFKYYRLLCDEEYQTKYSTSFLKHKAQLVYLEYTVRKDLTFRHLSEIKALLGNYIEEDIDWLILRNYYRFMDYNSILNYLKRRDPTPRTLAMEAIIELKINKGEHYNNFLRKKLHTKFEFEDNHYDRICNIVIMIKQGVSNSEIMKHLKELLDDEIIKYHESFFLEIIKIIYIEFAYKIGRYKEAAGKLLEIERNRRYLPYFI